MLLIELKFKQLPKQLLLLLLLKYGDYLKLRN